MLTERVKNRDIQQEGQYGLACNAGPQGDSRLHTAAQGIKVALPGRRDVLDGSVGTEQPAQHLSHLECTQETSMALCAADGRTSWLRVW